MDGDLETGSSYSRTADLEDAPCLGATPLPTERHVETGCSCGSWEMSQECMTSALA